MNSLIFRIELYEANYPRIPNNERKERRNSRGIRLYPFMPHIPGLYRGIQQILPRFTLFTAAPPFRQSPLLGLGGGNPRGNPQKWRGSGGANPSDPLLGKIENTALAALQARAAVWAGAITPVRTTANVSAVYSIPLYGNNQSEYDYRGRSCRPATDCDVLENTTQLGTFTFLLSQGVALLPQELLWFIKQLAHFQPESGRGSQPCQLWGLARQSHWRLWLMTLGTSMDS